MQQTYAQTAKLAEAKGLQHVRQEGSHNVFRNADGKVIVAINKDPDTPILKIARYGVVGDMHKTVPALTESFKKKLGK